MKTPPLVTIAIDGVTVQQDVDDDNCTWYLGCALDAAAGNRWGDFFSWRYALGRRREALWISKGMREAVALMRT